MDKYDTSQLTEFPRFEEESPQSGVSTFFNKFWKFPIFTTNESTEGAQEKAAPEDKQNAPQNEGNKQGNEDTAVENSSYSTEFEGRSLPNVLKRISSLIALGSGGGTRYEDTELARYWMPDEISRECYECATRFSAVRRRHHCRVCGQIFCSRCCSQRVPGQIFGCAGGLRVCNYCCNVVLSYLKENDISGDMTTDLRTLQENLQSKFPNNKPEKASSRDNFMFAREQEERCERSSPKEALQDVFKQIAVSLPTQQHRYRLVRFNGVWRGCDILQWIMDNTSNRTRAQATLVCQNLVTAGYMECAAPAELTRFADYALYRPLVLPSDTPQHETNSPEESNRLTESVSSYCLDLNLGESSARLTKAPPKETKSPSSEEDHSILEQIEGYTESKELCTAMSQSGEEHLKLLLRQCLAREALPPAWHKILYPLCQHAAHIVLPDITSNDIEVRNYVQIKKVPGDTIADSCVVPGVVMTKNVSHRGMPQQISNPTVLLLDCSIAYQRVEGKLTSLEPVLLQEQEYLSRCAARITALRPRVVLVRGSAARPVQDALREQGVALATAVRDRALRRAARCIRAEIVTSIDARIGMPRLGTCSNFYVKNFGSKTLMVLEGCAEPNLGCCILLRGASLSELARVKKVVKFMLLACYNWKLEKAFLADIEAMLPEPGMVLDDDDDVFKEKNELKDDRGSFKFDESKEEMDSDLKKGSENLNILNDVDESDSNKILKSSDLNSYGNSNKVDSNDRIDDSGINDCDTSDDKAQESNDNEPNFSNEITNDIFNVSNDLPNTKNDSAQTTKNYYVNDALKKDPNSDPTKTNDDRNSFDDPLLKSKPFIRKTDSDKTLSCGVPIRDFSDPLRSTLSGDDEVFLPKVEAKLMADEDLGDRWSTDDTLLSMSPNVVVTPPLLETDAGRRWQYRNLFPKPLLKQPAKTTHSTTKVRMSTAVARNSFDNKELHPFLKDPITTTIDDPGLRASLAHFRAVGSRQLNNRHRPGCPLYKPSVIKPILDEPEKNSQEKQTQNEPLDPFAPESHQRLSLLLYSYSNKSANVPDFCVNPWIATMEMYSKHDISLGAFLEKYCFNSEYKCSSSNCTVPMYQHVRKFVHGDVMITITCNTVGHSSTTKLKEEQSKQVMVWTRCENCGFTGRARRLSRLSLSLSLAQYVRTRCSAARLLRRDTCSHALHTHAHAFVSRLTTACFRYSKISTYEIKLPPRVITTKYDTKQMRDALINQLNELMLKSHETLTAASEGDACREWQATFRHHADSIHLALASATLTQCPTHAEVVRNLWTVSDKLISGEKMLRDAQEKWAGPVKTGKGVEAVSALDRTVEDKAELEDSQGDQANNDSSETEEDEEKGDKKTVRQILSQLLSNNQPSNQSGIIISSGVVPVVVFAGEIGSVIAATLASVSYHKSLKSQINSMQTEQEEADNLSTGKDKTDGEKSKTAKYNDHIEVLLRDSLLCRVYYAAQFKKLRHMLLCPLDANPDIADEFATKSEKVTENVEVKCCDDGKEKDGKSLCDIEEGFIRSLAHCVPWAARGGKSGSTFCKTKDDRYVLKEMTKPEWQQFLEFAPHYFSYVTSCHHNQFPSLLARIVGVYSVGGAGNGVLVMENVWYGCGPEINRYDLKGAQRHRLAPQQPQHVLMDENLLNLRWENPLFVKSHVSRVLRWCIERDTDFLAANGVMDYSLLLGIDGNILVLGLIDYIRTFTWDKRLEHLVKKNLGSGQPTVVSPEQYKRRFAKAADKYFPPCPAAWDHLYELLY